MNPQAVIWIISGKCNLNCIHCYASRFLSLPHHTVEERLRLIRELADNGVMHIGITGGEPLLEENLELYIKEIRDHGMTCDVNTNATLMNAEKARFFRRHEVFLYVSIDGASKETHEKIRGRGNWERLMKGLDIITKEELEFSTVMTISKLNYREIGDYVRLAEKVGAYSACMIPLMPSGRATEEIIPSEKELVQALKSAEAAADELDYWISVWCFRPAKLIINPKYVSTWADCRKGKIIDIDPAGNIMLCDVLDITIGNVRKGFKRALEEYSENEIVRKVMNPKLEEPCRSCPIRHECAGGCYARSYIAYKTFDGPDPYCPLAKSVKKLEEISR